MRVFIVLLLAWMLCVQTVVATPMAIYGNDSLKDLYQITDPRIRTLADGAVALFVKQIIQASDHDTYRLKSSPLSQLKNICPSEHFSDQPSSVSCSGAWIGKDLVLTAGHCVNSQDDCNSMFVAFGYEVSSPEKYVTELPSRNVYACRTLLHREHNPLGADFSIIQLDREVVGHIPLKIARHTQAIPNGTALMLAGFPMGLPLKLDLEGKVRNNSPSAYFVGAFDSFQGNSGSAIINLRSGELEGIFVRGEKDFEMKNGCFVYRHCAMNGCRGEDSTKISVILPYLPNSLE